VNFQLSFMKKLKEKFALRCRSGSWLSTNNMKEQWAMLKDKCNWPKKYYSHILQEKHINYKIIVENMFNKFRQAVIWFWSFISYNHTWTISPKSWWFQSWTRRNISPEHNENVEQISGKVECQQDSKLLLTVEKRALWKSTWWQKNKEHSFVYSSLSPIYVFEHFSRLTSNLLWHDK
jgi:hypothetical protein